VLYWSFLFAKSRGNEFHEEVNTTLLIKLEKKVSDIYNVLLEDYGEEQMSGKRKNFVCVLNDFKTYRMTKLTMKHPTGRQLQELSQIWEKYLN
jgi:hypothetical protein